MSQPSAIYLLASGDSRVSANTICWPAQEAMEADLTRILKQNGYEVIRAHSVDPEKGHGFLDSQRAGLDAVSKIPTGAKIVIAEAVWQYSHHVLPALHFHKGPILTVANWSGQWPGLVGMLNLNGSLTKAGIDYATLWSEKFEDDFFLNGLAEWLTTGTINHDLSHVAPFDGAPNATNTAKIADALVSDLIQHKSIMGVFDEGCMGMYNAIIPDDLLARLGVFKERLSQSALYAEVLTVSDDEAEAVFQWLVQKGIRFDFGTDGAVDLTRDQTMLQCKMYIAAVRVADQFDCETIGIQYQQGLKDLLPASDLVEGMLNNSDRPPVTRAEGSVIREGLPIVHFNEVDECAGLDALLINRTHRALGQPLETTLHDIRWGDYDASGCCDDFVWVFEISGAAPPEHHIGGWAGSTSLRQPAMYFPFGGGTLSGVAKPGSLIWSRVYVANNALHMDIGLGECVELSEEETRRRRNATTAEWPIMHAILQGVSQNQLMASHKSNHVQVVYATSPEHAKEAMVCRAQFAQKLGISVNIVGSISTNGEVH
ncbi:fucose isomerase [Cognatishimia maritima]|uniref:L-fucose isomerase n=1 Tax=Cognatishimia maritima TaxID=870908 RepID=A0A1M5VG89_9RHOB|nr:fucose isomerase [Cognatishimia maritima]SHH74240.1 L-fucose isomerase [Cognatishimia maritima]